ncbi:MAG: hypothetical protein EOO90_16950 [Pedobacter sp.]|nr:MAG: hypothetical protein EOO90_16950 [Pedobacter sp.]
MDIYERSIRRLSAAGQTVGSLSGAWFGGVGATPRGVIGGVVGGVFGGYYGGDAGGNIGQGSC